MARPVTAAAVVVAATAMTTGEVVRDDQVSGTLHVDAAAESQRHDLAPDGSRGRPYHSLHAAKERIVQQHERDGNSGIRRVQIHAGRYAPIALDHPALSGITWSGAGRGITEISGGKEIPRTRFEPWPDVPGAFTASIAGLGVDELGSMISGNEVADCQNDKVGLSYGGNAMINARWPNIPEDADETAPWAWSNAAKGCMPSTVGGTLGSTFALDANDDPAALRLLKWADEADAYVHGYWEWDWGDSYAPVSQIQRRGAAVELSYLHAPTCKPGARWMGVNLLSELDARKEFYIDTEQFRVYFFPPEPPSGVDGPVVALMYQPGGVLNITSAAQNVTISDMSVINGRHAGILVEAGVVGLQIERVVVHAHGTHGIVMIGAHGGSIIDSQVYDVGCSGIRATAGVADRLEYGGLVVARNHVHHVAQWKRSYMPGIYWGGVGNVYQNNVVEFHPHACFVGGGDFEDGVANVFEGNTLSVCVFETLDAGAFYSSGQRGTAFTNRGNIIRGNSFSRILNHAEGTGVQSASVQAVTTLKTILFSLRRITTFKFEYVSKLPQPSDRLTGCVDMDRYIWTINNRVGRWLGIILQTATSVPSSAAVDRTSSPGTSLFVVVRSST